MAHENWLRNSASVMSTESRLDEKNHKKKSRNENPQTYTRIRLPLNLCRRYSC